MYAAPSVHVLVPEKLTLVTGMNAWCLHRLNSRARAPLGDPVNMCSLTRVAPSRFSILLQGQNKNNCGSDASGKKCKKAFF